MKTLAFLSILVLAAGCGGKPDNSATRYAGSLAEDTSKAQAAADKANAAVAEQNARMQEAQQQAQ